MTVGRRGSRPSEFWPLRKEARYGPSQLAPMLSRACALIPAGLLAGFGRPLLERSVSWRQDQFDEVGQDNLSANPNSRGPTARMQSGAPGAGINVDVPLP